MIAPGYQLLLESVTTQVIVGDSCQVDLMYFVPCVTGLWKDFNDNNLK